MQRRTESLPPPTPARNGEAVDPDVPVARGQPAAPAVAGPRVFAGLRSRGDRRYAGWRGIYDADVRRGRGAA
jgi:hypothetical protein